MAFNRLRRMANEFADTFRGPTRRETEMNYLNGSISIADLEHRMGEIDRGKFRSF